MFPEIFDKTYFKAESIKSRLHETAYLNPGLSITFENRRPGEEETVLFHEEEGLKAYVRDLNKGKPAVGEIVYFKKKIDDIEVEAVSCKLLLMDSALKYVLSNISPSGKKVTLVPVSPFRHLPMTSNGATAFPLSYIC